MVYIVLIKQNRPRLRHTIKLLLLSPYVAHAVTDCEENSPEIWILRLQNDKTVSPNVVRKRSLTATFSSSFVIEIKN